MTRTPYLSRTAILFSCLASAVALAAPSDESKPPGITRTPWMTSRVIGSPEPPLPYTVEPVFKEISWDRPLYAKAEPGTDSLLVVLQGGENDQPSQVVRVQDIPGADHTDSVLKSDGRLIYGLEFAPDYQGGGHVFVFSNGPTGEPERKNRISRYRVPKDDRRVFDPESELVILEWRSMGHDGGDLVFGHDGMLYITSGDGTSDSDAWLSAQDVSNLLGGVLRIDVRQATAAAPYQIPSDNPFVEMADARDELWAFGLRNPWRMSIDQRTGAIWVGNNGQDLWETAHLLTRGANFGWSVYEGSHPFYLNRQRGPAAMTPPTIEHHHIEFRSLTGGVVYYGDEFIDLQGTYVYGDYATGKIWGARHDGNQLTQHQELADTTLQIAGFALTPRDELLVVDHGGGLYRLTQSKVVAREAPFPSKLSETGLFESTAAYQVARGVIPYSVNAPGWADGAYAERFLALPGETTIKYKATGSWDLPDGAVLMQTLFRDDPPHDNRNGNSAAHRIETRILTRQDGEWAGYSYRWNSSQDDALLVPREGADLGPMTATQTPDESPHAWRIPSRAECMSCHSRAANFVLGLSTVQIRGEAEGVGENQLQALDRLGLFQEPLPDDIEESRLSNPYDDALALDIRARSYLHVNCAGCHVSAGGGNARMELGFATAREDMKVVSVHPQHTTFDIDQAMLVAPGSPDRSVIYQRINRRGSGQMPPLVSHRVDRRAAQLIHDWIADMTVEEKFVRDWRVEDLVRSLAESDNQRSVKSGQEIYLKLGCQQCHRLRGEGGGAGPDLTELTRKSKLPELIESIVLPSKKVAPEFATTAIQTVDGQVILGRIERETESVVVIRTANAFAEPVTVAKDDIEERALTNKSIMPSGLLNSLEEHEILDLMAYLLSERR